LARAVQQQFKVAPKLAEEIVLAAHHHAKQEDLPVSLVLAVIAKESSFNPKAISHGDLGLMQVNSYWHQLAIKQAGGRDSLFSVDTNIRLGTRILSQYVRRYGIYEGLRAYNGKGKKNTYPADVLRLQKIFS
jgi:soluble lytic murein transglycosylase-like protein